jgi:RNA polymerase sigma-70 factor, ECF subfamily
VAVTNDPRTDEQLMAAYQRGEVGAYRVLVERHHAPVYRYCLRSLRSKEAAADATQEVFLKVVRLAPTWEQKAKVTTWVYTMARNHCIDEIRKGNFRKTESLQEPAYKGEVGEERGDNIAHPQAGSDTLVDNRRLRAVLTDAVASLPEEQRMVFLLRESSGLAFKDIADVVGANENTVKSRMRYALVALQRFVRERGFVWEGAPPAPS